MEKKCYIAPDARVLGDVELAEDVSIWYGAVVRGDSGKILIGEGTNIQDRVVIEESPLALWCLQNAIEIQNNYGDLKLSKRHKDDSERIDPVAAMMNALARVLVKKNGPVDLAAAMDRPGFSL